ncbi:MAG: hypothetical protein ACI4JD_08420 [Ruminococcus sp.]
MEERFVKASELLGREDFAEKLKLVESPEDVQKLFADNGVELSLEDIENMAMESMKNADDGEIDEDDLDNVSGGFVTTACFVIGGASLCFYSSVGYHKLKRWYNNR